LDVADLAEVRCALTMYFETAILEICQHSLLQMMNKSLVDAERQACPDLEAKFFRLEK